MLGYIFEIIYKKGKQNVVAYSLLRKGEDVEALICVISIIQSKWINEARDEGNNVKSCGHLFKSCSKISVHLIHLAGKMIQCGTNISYMFVRIPNSNKYSFGIPHLSLRRALRIFKNLP